MAKKTNDNNNNTPDPPRNPSVGTLALIETRSGQLRIQMDFTPDAGTDPTIMRRIHSAITGLAYSYDKNAEAVEGLGKAYLDGIEEGIGSMKRMQKKEAEKKKAYQGSAIGFGGDIKDE